MEKADSDIYAKKMELSKRTQEAVLNLLRIAPRHRLEDRRRLRPEQGERP